MNSKSYYWIHSAFKNALLLLIMCVIYGAMMYIGRDTKSLINIINETIMFYFMIVSICIGAVFCSTTIPLMLDVVLSLGSTRKDAFININIFLGIFTLLLTAIFVCLGLITGKSITTMLSSIITYVACILFSSGIGSFIGAQNLKKGSKLLFIYFATIIGVVVLSLGILIFSDTASVMTGGDFYVSSFKYEHMVTIGSVILAALFYPLGMSKMKKQLYTHEVRI